MQRQWSKVGLVIVALVVLAALPGMVAAQGGPEEIEPSSPAVKALYDYFNAAKSEGAEAFIADDFVLYINNALSEFQGVEGFAAWAAPYAVITPDFHGAILEELVGDDFVVVNYLVTGTHTGEVPGLPASGNAIVLPGVQVFKLNDEGKIYEMWNNFDWLSWYVQIGMMENPFAAAE